MDPVTDREPSYTCVFSLTCLLRSVSYILWAVSRPVVGVGTGKVEEGPPEGGRLDVDGRTSSQCRGVTEEEVNDLVGLFGFIRVNKTV